VVSVAAAEACSDVGSYMTGTDPSTTSHEAMAKGLYENPIDVDADGDRDMRLDDRAACIGFTVQFPAGKTPHSTYPFALHDKITLPWDYSITNSVMTLHARTCDWPMKGELTCGPCRDLASNPILQGILDRIANGVHEHSNYTYHGFSGLLEILRRRNVQIESLRLRGLNHTRLLRGQATSLSDHKRFVVAIGSGKFERVDRLVHVALKQKRGIRGILRLYNSAALGVYQPKSFSEEDDMRGLLLWKLGGNRVAQIAHRSLGLPALTTLRNRSIMPQIVPSHSTPGVVEIGKNIDACFESINDILQSRKVVHQILMLDEIATEKRLRWDHKTNCFLGVCREHGKNTSLEFSSEDDMEELFRSLDEGEVHYAAEVSVPQAINCSRAESRSLTPLFIYYHIGDSRCSRSIE
jgi:hypothetical protein